MNKDRLQYLYKRYINGTGSVEELAELQAYIKSTAEDEDLINLLDETWDELDENKMTDLSADKAEAMYQRIIKEERYKENNKGWMKIAASIAIFLSVALGVYMLYNNNKFAESNELALNQTQELVEPQTEAIVPGSNNAVLTLADGSQVFITEGDTGHLATQENVDISITSNGQLVYSVKGDLKPREFQYNTISTPRGGQYKISLPDGSKVWLNAESSLKYPVYFTGTERLVEMTGEAYFEISPDKTLPFKVIANNVEVKVLGTHFNVMAYDDENIVKTTLLEGSVNVNNQILKPGQQAQLDRKTNRMVVAAVDTEEAVAWKNGFFMFKNENIKSIMRKISRWYDVDVEFIDQEIGNKSFGGNISKYEDVSEVLHIMELTGVIQFETEGKKIKVKQ